jgi:hypothetical protein
LRSHGALAAAVESLFIATEPELIDLDFGL